MPTVADYNAEVLREVGDPNGTLASLFASPTFLLWNLVAEKANGNTQLQALYTRRSALDIRLAEEYDRSDFQAGRREIMDRQSQRWDHLNQMRADTQTEIERLEALLRASRVPVTGAIAKVAPESPPFPDMIDGNAPALRGDVYTPGRARW